MDDKREWVLLAILVMMANVNMLSCFLHGKGNEEEQAIFTYL